MISKMADKIGLKQRNCHFEPNLRLLETDFFKNNCWHFNIYEHDKFMCSAELSMKKVL